MVPSAFVLLDALPLTPNGKVDRRALLASEQSRPELKAAFIAPRTPAEEILAGIWSQLLGLREIGVHDDFFELGGDSILSIQVISRAGQAGLRLTPKQLFEHPTVAGLAAVAEKGPAVQAEQGIVEGPLPLTPIQRWFFDLNVPEPQHWNQSLLFEVRRPLDRALLKSAVAHLLAHHDALRLQFERTPQGWQQTNATAGDDVPVAWIDLSRLSETDQQQAIETHTNALQVSLNLSAGPVLRMAYFYLGSGRSARLLMIVHQLVVDRVSWSIFLADLLTAYQQLSQGQTVRLPLKTTSFREWAHRLETYARSEAIRKELGYWLKLSSHAMTRLPVDNPDSENTEASARSLTLSLDAEATRGLLQDVPDAYRAGVDEALLAALAQTFERWSGSRELWIEFDRQGREGLFEDVDMTRTVGWFETRFPVRFELGNNAHQGEALKAIKEQLRQVPQQGIGYGLLRYLSQDEEIVRQLQAIPQPEVSFSFLGEVDSTPADDAAFEPVQGPKGPERSPNSRRRHLIDIVASISGGLLRVEWSYGENIHRLETIERLAQDFTEALRSLIAHCQTTEESGYSPSDFQEFGWSQSDLDNILAQIGRSD
jgi:non-ribosomal peptide synthase protein (TIGR01720 family)